MDKFLVKIDKLLGKALNSKVLNYFFISFFVLFFLFPLFYGLLSWLEDFFGSFAAVFRDYFDPKNLEREVSETYKVVYFEVHRVFFKFGINSFLNVQFLQLHLANVFYFHEEILFIFKSSLLIIIFRHVKKMLDFFEYVFIGSNRIFLKFLMYFFILRVLFFIFFF